MELLFEETKGMASSSSFSPLLFLEFEGVLALGNTKQQQVAQALCAIERGHSNWRDHHGLWGRLFEPEPVRQLKSLHEQFRPQYCLTTNWTSFMDKATTLNLLRLSGLGFVASNLHEHWNLERGQRVERRPDVVERWLLENSARRYQWAIIDAEVRDPAIQHWPEHLHSLTVFCRADSGLTGIETGEVRKKLVRQLQRSPDFDKPDVCCSNNISSHKPVQM